MSNLLAERLILTLWVGSLWAIGYLAVPIAFASLGDVSLAGNYAGKLFFAVNLLGLGCGSVLLLSKLIALGKQAIVLWRFWIVVVMLLLTMIFSFYLQPEIASIKQLAWQSDEGLVARFSLFHTISKNLYLLLSLLGLTLVVSTDKSVEKTEA